jgi:hypothetical protein
MNGTQLVSIAVGLLIGFGGGWYAHRPSDPVAARVNGDEIRSGALQQELSKRFGNDVLRDLVNQKLIAQEAAKQKITVSESTIATKLEQLKQKPSVQPLLKSGQVTEEDLRRNLTTLVPWDLITEKLIKEDDEKEFLLQHREELESLELQELIFADEADVKKQLPTPEQWSKINVQELHRSQLNPSWAEVLFKLKKGDISPPLAGPDGIHIFRVGEHRFEYKNLKDLVREQLIAQKRGEVLEDIRHRAKVEVLPPYKLRTEDGGAVESPPGASKASASPGSSGSPAKPQMDSD